MTAASLSINITGKLAGVPVSKYFSLSEQIPDFQKVVTLPDGFSAVLTQTDGKLGLGFHAPLGINLFNDTFSETGSVSRTYTFDGLTAGVTGSIS